MENKPMLSEIVDIPNKHSLYKLGTTEVELINHGPNQGEIKIRDTEMGNFSAYWGAMGGTIERFIYSINEDYFTLNLLDFDSRRVFDVAGTFRNVRKHIREEIGLKWYYHMEFQKQLRDTLNLFQSRCKHYNSKEYFVDHFSDYLDNRIRFDLITYRVEQTAYRARFQEMDTPWHFIETKESQTAKWLKSLHKKIKHIIEAK